MPGTKITDTNGNVISTALDKLGRKTSYTDPDMGTWTYTYDANGNLETQTDAKNQTIGFTYDALNRVTLKDYPTGTDVNYFYDETTPDHGYSKGRLTRVTYDVGEDFFKYDNRGRIKSTTRTLDRKPPQTLQTTLYDSLDRPVTTQLPDGETVTNTYNTGGALETLSGTNNYVTNINYTALGKVSYLAYGNGKATTYDYYDTVGDNDPYSGLDLTYRLKSIYTPGVLSLSYAYDTRGNIMAKTDNITSTYSVTYEYDHFSRLTDATSTVYTGIYGNSHVSYTYDPINNLTSKEGRTYTYSTTKPHQVLNDGTYTYTYDNNGNMITRSGGRTMYYDYDNRLTSVSDGGEFKYDPTGQRTRKIENGVTTYYFFGCYEEEWQDGAKTKSTKYYFANGMRVAERSSTDGLRYYHTDHLGSSTAITNADGTQVLLNMGYTPYGSTAYSTGGAMIKYQYTGQEKDACGLMYYNARYYDPELGRFIQPDTMLDGLNRYTYCGGNPIVYCDPSGHFVLELMLVGAFIFGVVIANVLYEALPQETQDFIAGIFDGTSFKVSTNGSVTVGLCGGTLYYNPNQAILDAAYNRTMDGFNTGLLEYNRFMEECRYSKIATDFFSAGGPGGKQVNKDQIDFNLLATLYISPASDMQPYLFVDDGFSHYCNWLAYNVAISRGVNPGLSKLILNWNDAGGGYNIGNYGGCVTDEPIANTAGWVFFYDGDPTKVNAGHMEYYEFRGGNQYVVWETSGRVDLPKPRPIDIGNNPNMWGNYNNIRFVPLGPAPEVFKGYELPWQGYHYRWDHQWK